MSDLGNNVEELYQSFRKIKEFSETAHKPETIEGFMRYSIQQAINNAHCPSDFDSLVVKDQLGILKSCYLKIEGEYKK